MKHLNEHQVAKRGEILASYTQNGKNRVAVRKLEQLMKDKEALAIVNALAAALTPKESK